MKIVDLYESEFLVDRDKIISYMSENFSNFEPNRLTIESDGLVYDGDLISIKNVDKLKVQFKSVSGYFNCGRDITSLVGCPGIVGGYFSCDNTNITTLKYCPTSIGGIFHCHNIKITDTREYRYALYSEIGGTFYSDIDQINEIINTYGGADNRKYWPRAINLLIKVKL